MTTHRQQSLHHLTHTPQTQGAYRERELQHLAPRRLEDPVEGKCEQEECDKVECFVGLLVRWDLVVGWGESGGGGDEDEEGECRCWVGVSLCD